eukprot:scaffold8815_cov52-Cyclotella_meneghiniana.AAC.3
MLVQPNNNGDVFVETKSTLSLTRTSCGSFDSLDMTAATIDSEASYESATTSDKSRIAVSFKLGTPQRRKTRMNRRHSMTTPSQSLPPQIAPTISFDDLGGEDSPTPSHIPDLNSEETKAARLPIFRTPLPLRKTRDSPVKKKLLSKSLTLPKSISLANEVEISLEKIGSFGRDDVPKHTVNASWFPIERSRDLSKKSVRFSPEKDEVHLIHYDWTCAGDYFYSTAEIATMKSARFEDAALFRNEEKTLDTQDDLDMSRRQKIVCIDYLLSLALNDPDANIKASIRGIEHMVYPELQQEMIRKKKEVQAQVMSFVRSKRPDPQGWRLANHSRMYSQWARDVALEKGQAYTIKIDIEEVKSPTQDCKKVEPRRRRGARRRTDSMFSSMPSVGDGAAIAAVVKMQFFGDVTNQAESLATSFQGLQMNEDHRDVARGNEQSACHNESREDYDEA